LPYEISRATSQRSGISLRLVATGIPKRAVYDQVYGRQRDTDNSHSRESQAQHLAAKPHIAEEIEASIRN
jgi:hypothetical protein